MAVAPTVTPRKIVTMLISSFCAVFDILSTTPDSLKRFPSISIPMSGATDGSSRIVIIDTTIGNRIRSSFETSRSWLISVSRSFFVVSARMMGGWIMGMRAI